MTSSINNLLNSVLNFLRNSFENKIFYLFLLLLFLFRVSNGLSHKFWNSDEIQVYLIGLKQFCTGNWSYWGADVVYTKSRIPGGLQGLIISLPLKVFSIPESPIIFLNIISFLSICSFAWYLSKRIEFVPKWFIWTFLLLCPWTIHFSTHIINTSYILCGSILFFISSFETAKIYAKPIIQNRLSYFLMGVSLFWIFQFHMSWVLLVPFILYSLSCQRDLKTILASLFFLITGSLMSSLSLIPTLLRYTEILLGGTEKNIVFNYQNSYEFLTILAKFISLSCFEISRYMSHIPILFDHVKNHPIIFPVALVLFLSGVMQSLYIMASLFRKNGSSTFKKVRTLFIAVFILTYISFLFSIKSPTSYTIYVLFPVSILYAFYALEPFFKTKKIEKVLLTLIIFVGLYHISFSVYSLNQKSLYINRNDAKVAIDKKEHTFSNRRRLAFFEIPNISELWKVKQNLVNDSIISTSYSCNFEYLDDLTRPQNLSKNKAFSGQYSCLIHKKMPFSIGYEIPFANITSDSLNISFDLFAENNSKHLWVISIVEKNKTKAWHSVPIKIKQLNSWSKYQYSFRLPKNITKESTIKTYFWIPDEEDNYLSYIDNITLSG